MSENLTLADGTVISCVDGMVEDSPKPLEVASVGSNPSLEYEVLPSYHQHMQNVEGVRKRIGELPLPADKMNVVSLVLSYCLLGLSKAEIGTMLGITEQQVINVTELDAFSEIQEEMIKNITATDKDAVRNMFVVGSKHAAGRMINFMDSRDPAVAMAASKDVLDRAGHRPAEVAEHNHTMDGGLRIEIVRKDREPVIPVIDLKVEE